MNDVSLKHLLPAMDIAAFERALDGSFSAVAPIPSWFERLATDTTFPFLGHVLEEAIEFWASGTSGFNEFGPCVEVDASGREFHYKVIAVWAASQHYLLFQPDLASDRMREVLQKVRERALSADADSRAQVTLATVHHEVRRSCLEVRELLRQFGLTKPDPGGALPLERIYLECQRLERLVENMVRAETERRSFESSPRRQ